MSRLTAFTSASFATVLLAGLLTVLGAAPARAEPPGIPDPATAAAQLNALVVAEETHQDSYNRTLFPHWITISGTCNTRETVLRRDGSAVVVNAFCAATSGTWYSPYDGATWMAASDIDIDHMVPLYEAWRSGAWAWTTAQRRAFANDLATPQLWAVTDNVNQGKSDQDPSTWQPPLAGFGCTYASAWIAVKHAYALTLQAAERDALTEMLATC
ncbi:HNH endonuclease family protein [Sphaerisporangium sp. NPDC051017]|uniref:HNH endonuclease family protein n=1 Tax=unclassified Sphaerisporangium TaxID=2630420 RepID=UPI00340E88C2